ncbi:hypothetical protein K1T36_21015 [Pseudomonas protegens]|uniref:hypothetical protein n=1 Tax=Pseudomonas protegens TaxID=380021 RepID=UPI001C6995CB|nr:hypothetical protein [Pseudomonas protegens]QYM99548.1 hypothetical protein K1T36_21015 [Pseudomonas protegens]
MSEKMREAYKMRRAKLAGLLIQGEDWPGAYRRADEILSWSCFEAGWQASRQAVVVELPQPHPMANTAGDMARGIREATQMFKSAIEAQGLKVK